MKNLKLIAARKQSGKTQTQAAKEIGIAKNAYQRYEQGKVILNAIFANRIARIPKTTSENLWGY